MFKDDKPLEYQRRIRDTKGLAQRLDLRYLNRIATLPLLRRRLTWVLVLLAAVATVPLLMGIGSSRKQLQSGPLSEAHALLEGRCEICHMQVFDGVPDKACMQCHDGAAHPAKQVDISSQPTSQIRCAQCHAEHRGKTQLAAVDNGNCTTCHSHLEAHAKPLTIGG